MEKKEIIQLIYSVIDKVNELMLEGEKLSKSTGTKLYGDDGQLDSLGMVNFIVTLEQRIEETQKVSVSLVNETTMSQQNSPFQNVDTLAEYIQQLLTKDR